MNLFLGFKKSKHLLFKLAMCVMFLSLIPGSVEARLVVRIAEAEAERLQFDLSSNSDEAICSGNQGRVFNPALAMRKLSETAYSINLNSVAADGEDYLKAARMGAGIYVYLPYFFPARVCKDVEFEIVASHILWDGKWLTGRINLRLDEVRGKSIFFTNEVKPNISGQYYFDAGIPTQTLHRLQSAFAKITDYFEQSLKLRLPQNIGVIAAIARNEGAYSGYGGDANNIIRMSIDNPAPSQLANLDEFMSATYAHELAHKLQTEQLYTYGPARYIVEGQAEFFKILILFNTGLLDESAAKQAIAKAIANCTNSADARTVEAKLAQKTYSFREPYDCGLAYYFAAFYSSDLSIYEFTAALRKAMLAERNYSIHDKRLCLLLESDCHNERLIGMLADKTRYLQQIQWLSQVLASRSLPLLK